MVEEKERLREGEGRKWHYSFVWFLLWPKSIKMLTAIGRQQRLDIFLLIY